MTRILLKLCIRTLLFYNQLDPCSNPRLLKYLKFSASKSLKSCLVFFTERRDQTSFKVKHLQYYIKGVLFTVPFTKNNFCPIFRTENV